MTVLYIDEKRDQQQRFVRNCERSGYPHLKHVVSLLPNADFSVMIEEILDYDSFALVSDFNLSEGRTNISYTGLDVIKAIGDRKTFYPVVLITHFIDDALNKDEKVWRIFEKEKIFTSEEDGEGGSSSSFFSRLEKEIAEQKNELDVARTKHAELLKKLRQDDISTKEFEEFVLLDSALTKSCGSEETVSFEALMTSRGPMQNLLDQVHDLITDLKQKVDEGNNE